MTSPKQAQPRDPWERRLIRKLGLSQPMARALADVLRGRPD